MLEKDADKEFEKLTLEELEINYKEWLKSELIEESCEFAFCNHDLMSA